jgi:hypothetical protein
LVDFSAFYDMPTGLGEISAKTAANSTAYGSLSARRATGEKKTAKHRILSS